MTRRPPNRLKKFLNRTLVLDTRSALVITALWVALASSLEVTNHLYTPRDTLRYGAGVGAVVFNAGILLFVAYSLVRRLLEIVRGHRTAGWRDIGAVAFAYAIVVLAFAAVFMGWENYFGAKNVFKYSDENQMAYVHMVDYVYLSGITIATVGYGDLVPVSWYSKLTAVFEALTGLWLTVFVAGVFVSSLLGRQDLEKRTKFLTTFQRRYLGALREHLKALDLVEKLLSEGRDLGPDEYEALDRQLSEFQESILQTVAQLVDLQYEPSSSASITANWMRLYLYDEARPEELKLAEEFTHPDYRAGGSKKVWGVLVLHVWGDRPPGMPESGKFALPVYDPFDPAEEDRQLRGAPEAVGNVDGYVIVSDSSKLDLGNQHPEVRANLVRYLKSRAPDLRSFASVRVEYEEDRAADEGGEESAGEVEDGSGVTTLGVINIQSDEPELCGTSPEVQQLLVDIIRPFAAYLAKAEYYRWSAGGETS